MINLKTCHGKLEVLYREIESRADYFGTSISELKSYGCSITGHQNVLDCVLGFHTHTDECGMVTTYPGVIRYCAYHFVVKRNLTKFGNKESVLLSANWVEDVIKYWSDNFCNTGEHMMIAVLYEDRYYFFDVERLALVHKFNTSTGRDKYTKEFPCYNPRTHSKERNRVIMIPTAWGERYGYMQDKATRDKIYHRHGNTIADNKDKNNQEPGVVFTPYLHVTNPTLVGNYNPKGISPLI